MRERSSIWRLRDARLRDARRRREGRRDGTVSLKREPTHQGMVGKNIDFQLFYVQLMLRELNDKPEKLIQKKTSIFIFYVQILSRELNDKPEKLIKIDIHTFYVPIQPRELNDQPEKLVKIIDFIRFHAKFQPLKSTVKQ